MKVAVIGAGVTGVTTSYFLAERGIDVVLFERAAEPAAETSHANAAQLSYSYTDALAQPGLVGRLPALAAGRDPAIRLTFRGNAALLRWGLALLGQCTPARAKANTLAVLETAMRSARLLAALRERVPLEFAWRRAGKLALIARPEAVPGVEIRTAWKREHGCDTRVIDFAEALAVEPALEQMPQPFAAAVYSPDDEVGDARAFTAGLAAWLREKRSVETRFDAEILGLDIAAGRVARVVTASGEIDVDAAVVCAGPWSPTLVAPLGIRLSVYPMRGYSVTLPAGNRAPSVSVTHVDRRIVFSRLGDRVRIAGFADLLGFDTRRDSERIDALVSLARSTAPEAADYETVGRRGWGGFRPVTPNSRPVVGATPVSGLYLNTGHGVLGWTLACATAHDVAQRVSEDLV